MVSVTGGTPDQPVCGSVGDEGQTTVGYGAGPSGGLDRSDTESSRSRTSWVGVIGAADLAFQ